MTAILIGASHDTLGSGNIPLSAGHYRFSVEGLVDSAFTIEHSGLPVLDGVGFDIPFEMNVRLIRVKEGSERMKINIHIYRT